MLSKESPEYISNGHYRVNGVDFMSIWTYKNRNNISPNNNKANSANSAAMSLTYGGIESVPDFGNFDSVYVFRLTDLNEYFSNK